MTCCNFGYDRLIVYISLFKYIKEPSIESTAMQNVHLNLAFMGGKMRTSFLFLEILTRNIVDTF